VIEAINAGRIPPAFQEDLQSRANELVNTVNCPPPPAEDDSGDDESKQDEKKKNKEEPPPEELVPTEPQPLPTVPEGEG
jgi:hypothetical protein